MKIFYLTILVFNIIFAEQKIIFQSANPFSFKDIVKTKSSNFRYYMSITVIKLHNILQFIYFSF